MSERKIKRKKGKARTRFVTAVVTFFFRFADLFGNLRAKRWRFSLRMLGGMD